jgi:hypothetical protein
MQDGIHHRVPAPGNICRPQHGLRVIAPRGREQRSQTSASALTMGLGCSGAGIIEGVSRPATAPVPTNGHKP